MKYILYIALAFTLVSSSLHYISEGGEESRLKVTLLPQKENLVAGEPIVYLVEEAIESKTYLLVEDLGMSSVCLELSGKELIKGIVLPSEISNTSGYHRLYLLDNFRELARIGFYIDPAEVTGRLNSISGPRTVKVGAEEQYMLVTMAKDEFGNPVDSTSVAFQSNKSSTAFPIYKSDYRNEFWAIGTSSLRSGYAEIAGSVQNSNSYREKIYEVPAEPVKLSLSTPTQEVYADGHSVVEFACSDLKDRFGNTMVDGTLVYLNEKSNEQSGSYYSYTLGGRATFLIKSHQVPKEVTYQASVSTGALSNVLDLSYKSYIHELKYYYDKENKILSVGPLTGNYGELVPDGFKVRFKIDSDLGFYLEANSEDGLVDFDLKDKLPPGSKLRCLLSAGGIEQKLELLID